jgi:hypothetical protein
MLDRTADTEALTEVSERRGRSAAGLAGQHASMVAEVVRYAPGEIPSALRAGDLIFIRSKGLLAFSIRAAGWVRHRKSDRRYAHWSHAAIAVSPTRLVEVHAAGVGLCGLEKYRDSEFHHVRLDLPELPRRRAANYASSCLRQPYGIGTFFLLGLAIVLGDSFRIPDRGDHGCVALIVRALQQAGLTFDREPQDMTPADLARNLAVLP